VKRGSGYSILYAAILGLVCALALTAVDSFTAARKAANEEAEEVRNILTVLGVPFDDTALSAELLTAYEENVETEQLGDITYYVYDHPEAGRLRATRFRGAGLWGPIEGLLCLENDLRTISAISFYRQEETPGLGGEIGSKTFQDQFRGKSIVDATGAAGIRIVGDGAEAVNEVDAISGATMTGDKVEDMLNDVIGRIAGGGGRGGE
jgi:Na+-transporting NADH:ubiquinone oxidoreductase subunit C